MSYTNYFIPSGATVTFNSVSLGDISDKGAKIRLKEKNIDFGPTQECAGIVKRIPILSSIEAEFEIDDHTITELSNALGYGDIEETLVITMGQQEKPNPYILKFLIYDSVVGNREVSITNMIPSAETLELLYNRKVQAKIPFKFISCGTAVLTYNPTGI